MKVGDLVKIRSFIKYKSEKDRIGLFVGFVTRHGQWCIIQKLDGRAFEIPWAHLEAIDESG